MNAEPAPAAPESSLFFAFPASFGVSGGFQDTYFPTKTGGTTGRALGLGTTMGGGPRLGLALTWRYLYLEADFENLIWLGSGGVLHAQALVGASYAVEQTSLVFAGLGPRVWSAWTSPNDGSIEYDTGPRAALVASGGFRFTPWDIHFRRSRTPGRLGFALQGTGPLAGGGGWSATLSLALGKWFSL